MSSLKARWRQLKFRIDAQYEGMTIEDLRSRNRQDLLTIVFISKEGYLYRKDCRPVFDDEESIDLNINSESVHTLTSNAKTFYFKDYGTTWYIDKEYTTTPRRELDDSRKALLIKELEKAIKR